MTATGSSFRRATTRWPRPDPARRPGCVGRASPPAARSGPLNLNTATAAELDALPGHRPGDPGQDHRLADAATVPVGRGPAHAQAGRGRRVRPDPEAGHGPLTLGWPAALRLPRSGWLALGTVGGALALGSDVPPAPIGAGDRGPCARLDCGGRTGSARLAATPPRRRGAALLVLGAGDPAGRRAGAPAWPPALPLSSAEAIAGPGRFEAVVESVGSPKAAEQIALLARRDRARRPVTRIRSRRSCRAIPEVDAGDQIAVSGRLEPPGDDDFGAYLRRVGAAGSLRSPTLELRRRTGRAAGRARPDPARLGRRPGPGPARARRPASPTGS